MDAEWSTLAVVVAGAVGVPLVQGINKLVEATGRRLEGLPALYLTVGVSVGLAALALGVSGGLAQPFSWGRLGGAIAGVFSVATLIYKTMIEQLAQEGEE
jgi:hypothetical protein